MFLASRSLSAESKCRAGPAIEAILCVISCLWLQAPVCSMPVEGLLRTTLNSHQKGPKIGPLREQRKLF